MFAVVVFDSVFSVLSQETGWEERLQNDPFCVRWNVKVNSIINLLFTWESVNG